MLGLVRRDEVATANRRRAREESGHMQLKASLPTQVQFLRFNPTSKSVLCSERKKTFPFYPHREE